MAISSASFTATIGNARAVWLKIEVIRAALDDNYDFVLWMDVDAVVLRNDVDIRSAAVDAADLHMAWHGPDTSEIMAADFVPHFNSGVMLIRVTDWSRAFFERVWEIGSVGASLVRPGDHPARTRLR